MRSIKDDIDLYLDIENKVTNRLNPDFTQQGDLDEIKDVIHLIFENQNKWLLSDKISAEKQGRMDSYKADKAQGSMNSSGFDSPTEKQINFATMLGINVEGKTKKEVSELIDKANKKEPRK